MFRFLRRVRHFRRKHRSLYHFGLVVFFWALADGVASFAFPVYLEQSLKDLAIVGLVFSSSSMVGLLTAIILGSEQKGRTYKPYFLAAISMALAAYILALKAIWWPVFVIIMGLWGFYYESINFCWVDFLDRASKKVNHSTAAGFLQMFNSLGYLLGPLIAGLFVLGKRGAMLAAICLLLISLLFFTIWFGRKKLKPELPKRKLRFLTEVKVWLRIGRRSFWLFMANFFLIVFWESIIWSMGPVMLTASFGAKAVLVMACFTIPSVFFRGFSGKLADKGDKKAFILLGLVVAGTFLSIFSLVENPILKAGLGFLSAFGACLFWPASDGRFNDLLDGFSSESKEEISAMRGSSSDLGYIFGPMLSGLLGKFIGLPATFYIYGCLLIFCAWLMNWFWRE